MTKKRRFWTIILLLVFAAWIILDLLAVALSANRGRPLEVAIKAAVYLLLGFLVAMLWAIVYRAQIEEHRVTLRSIFVLMTMEAALFLVVHLCGPL